MTAPVRSCPACGDSCTPEQRFCDACGHRLDVPVRRDAARAVQEAVRHAGAAVQAVETSVRAAADARDSTSAPPARWKVIVGDGFPGDSAVPAGGAIPARASGAAGGAVVSAPGEAGPGPAKPASPGGGKTTGESPPPAPKVKCPSCGAALRPGRIFCSACGMAVHSGEKGASGTPGMRPWPAGNRCSSCGAMVKPGLKFCESCGARRAPQ